MDKSFIFFSLTPTNNEKYAEEGEKFGYISLAECVQDRFKLLSFIEETYKNKNKELIILGKISIFEAKHDCFFYSGAKDCISQSTALLSIIQCTWKDGINRDCGTNLEDCARQEMLERWMEQEALLLTFRIKIYYKLFEVQFAKRILPRANTYIYPQWRIYPDCADNDVFLLPTFNNMVCLRAELLMRDSSFSQKIFIKEKDEFDIFSGAYHVISMFVNQDEVKNNWKIDNQFEKKVSAICGFRKPLQFIYNHFIVDEFKQKIRSIYKEFCTFDRSPWQDDRLFQIAKEIPTLVDNLKRPTYIALDDNVLQVREALLAKYVSKISKFNESKTHASFYCYHTACLVRLNSSKKNAFHSSNHVWYLYNKETTELKQLCTSEFCKNLVKKGESKWICVPWKKEEMSFFEEIFQGINPKHNSQRKKCKTDIKLVIKTNPTNNKRKGEFIFKKIGDFKLK